MEEFEAQAPVVKDDWRSATMLAPLEVQKMLALKALGWDFKRTDRPSRLRIARRPTPSRRQTLSAAAARS